MLTCFNKKLAECYHYIKTCALSSERAQENSERHDRKFDSKLGSFIFFWSRWNWVVRRMHCINFFFNYIIGVYIVGGLGIKNVREMYTKD